MYLKILLYKFELFIKYKIYSIFYIKFFKSIFENNTKLYLNQELSWFSLIINNSNIYKIEKIINYWNIHKKHQF